MKNQKWYTEENRDGEIWRKCLECESITPMTKNGEPTKVSKRENIDTECPESYLHSGYTSPTKWTGPDPRTYDAPEHVAETRSIPEQINLILCDCGHKVESSSVMNASLGTSCPNCYDKMS